MIVVMIFIDAFVVRNYINTQNEDVKRVGRMKCCRKGNREI